MSFPPNPSKALVCLPPPAGWGFLFPRIPRDGDAHAFQGVSVSGPGHSAPARWVRRRGKIPCPAMACRIRTIRECPGGFSGEGASTCRFDLRGTRAKTPVRPHTATSLPRLPKGAFPRRRGNECRSISQAGSEDGQRSREKDPASSSTSRGGGCGERQGSHGGPMIAIFASDGA